ncbi:hypothetical protein BAL199_20825 [alpha proteobacterium BAL199]|jgi:outer membrane protein assembly factor BamB|nr:hypothetical protein BAL199_20825 [alpha proteobacterium BAL199]
MRFLPLAAAAVALLWASPPALADEPLGTPPAYAAGRTLTTPPNADAMELRIWVPDLDQGDVPQGLTVLNGKHVLVTTYRESKAGPQDCRLHRFDAETGAHTGSADVPTACSHGGGMAVAGGRLFVTDTWALIELDADALFDPARHDRSVLKTTSLRFPIRGSFAAGTEQGLWIGEYKRSTGASLRFVSLASIDAADPATGLAGDVIEREIPTPARSQGATVAADGTLWVSASSSQFGKLYRLDPANGDVLAEFAAPVGTEDLGMDAAGRMWTVSEAGAGKYLNWPAFHPLVMRLQPSRLR